MTTANDPHPSTVSLRRLRLETLKAYGGKCACCGSTYYRHLEIDHVHGDGAAERRELNARATTRGQGGQHRLFKILRDRGYPKGDYQVLCRSCNFAKGQGEACPCAEGTTVDEALALLPPRKRASMPGAGRPLLPWREDLG